MQNTAASKENISTLSSYPSNPFTIPNSSNVQHWSIIGDNSLDGDYDGIRGNSMQSAKEDFFESMVEHAEHNGIKIWHMWST